VAIAHHEQQKVAHFTSTVASGMSA
jgi:hypothetical protein